MVSDLSITFMYISLAISILFPLGLAVYFYKKQRISIFVIFIGALTFFVFQFVLRIPILGMLSLQYWYISLMKNTLLMSLFLALTAGLFEEIGRFLAFKFVLKNKLERKNGIAFGIGHGGIESVLLLGITSITNLAYSKIINSGMFEEIVASKLPAETAESLRSSLVDTPSYVFALGGVERIFAIIIQIALSILVLYGVKREQFKYVIYAILAHTVINFPLAYVSKLGTIAAEIYIALCAAAALVFIIKSKNMFRSDEGGELI